MWSHDHRVKSAKCSGHNSCGSGDLIYFDISCKKKDTNDYLITKCDNSISQALLTYFVLQNAAK